ncbi:MAG: hypothetical protein O2910_03490 [Proteobacteria bacterium]|nr:hypothetical protein [Pseudomonadota bacterium]
MSTMPAGGTFSIGEVIAESFSILIKNLVPFLVLAIILVAIPGFILNRLTYSAGSLEAIQTLTIVGSLISGVLGYVLTAAIVYGAFQTMTGKTASLGEIVSRGLGVVLPVIGVALLVGIGTAIGTLLLVVPGIILMTMWAVAIPAAVLERPGVIASITRSAELTKGNRWQVFGLYVVYAVIALVIGLIFGGAAVAGSMGGGGGGLIFVIFSVLFTAALQAYFGVAVTVLYGKLRNIKDGVSVTEIAKIFD